MHILSKTSSCRPIIKTFAVFAIILSSNTALGITNQRESTGTHVSQTVASNKATTNTNNTAPTSTVEQHVSKTLVKDTNIKTAPSKTSPTPKIEPHISGTLKTGDDSKAKKTTSKTEEKPGYRMITEVELQGIIEKLPEKDKAIIHEIQTKIADWPDEVFQEVRSYNEFMMLVTNQAKDRYKKLSPAARQALDAEKNLKKNLSSSALETLSTLHVENAY